MSAFPSLARFSAPALAACLASRIFLTRYARRDQFHAIHAQTPKLSHPPGVVGRRVSTHAVGWLW
jgi:hypothetical protein